MEEMRNENGVRNTENKSGRNKSFLISNYFTYKQIKHLSSRD